MKFKWETPQWIPGLPSAPAIKWNQINLWARIGEVPQLSRLGIALDVSLRCSKRLTEMEKGSILEREVREAEIARQRNCQTQASKLVMSKINAAVYGDKDPASAPTTLPQSSDSSPPMVAEATSEPTRTDESSEQSASAPENIDGLISEGEKFTQAQQSVIREDVRLEEECRYGMPHQPETDKVCGERSRVLKRLNAAGICFGKESEPYSTKKYHHCDEDSIRE